MAESEQKSARIAKDLEHVRKMRVVLFVVTGPPSVAAAKCGRSRKTGTIERCLNFASVLSGIDENRECCPVGSSELRS
jgi:hypothetical protein